MRLSRLLVGILLVSIFLTLVLWFFQAGTDLADNLTFVLLILICLICIVLLWFGPVRSRTLMLVLVLSIFLSFVQRTIYLLVVPDDFHFKFLNSASPDSLNHTLLYIILGAVVAGIGLGLGSSTHFPTPKPGLAVARDFFYESRRYLSAFSLVSLVVTFLLAYLGQIALSGGDPSPLGWVTRIFDIDVFLYVNVIFLQCYSREMSRGERWAAILYCLGYLALTIFRGQRSGIVNIFFMWLFCKLVREFRPKISRAMIFSALAVLVLLAGFLYNFAWSVRYAWLTTGALDPESITEYYTYFTDLGPNAILSELSNHVGETDRLLAIVSNWGSDPSAFNGLDAFFAEILKGFVPSQLFLPDGVTLSRAFTFLFGGVPLELQTAAHWTGLGIGYGYFGWWGGLVAIFGWALVSAQIFHRLPDQRSGIGIFARITFLYLFIFSGFTTGYFELLIPNIIRGMLLVTGIAYIPFVLFRPAVPARSELPLNAAL